MKARSDILRMSDGAVEGGHPNRISGCPEDIKKMYSTSDPDICRTSDGLPCVMWVTAISAKLGSPLSEAIPGFPAFTGCDYCPAFSRKGKVGPLRILESSVSPNARLLLLVATKRYRNG
ncbi:hypothetical protein OUZ56_025328 [Daphnia magna]|uniref:Uncharacterized protein n=1 Tax=Daphnia magna TaxID=35525 RepID=A0ABQ9ZK63_9CRUS|nr:hypothetical protein OUZ56_025328 [Daphnia magna]